MGIYLWRQQVIKHNYMLGLALGRQGGHTFTSHSVSRSFINYFNILVVFCWFCKPKFQDWYIHLISLLLMLIYTAGGETLQRVRHEPWIPLPKRNEPFLPKRYLEFKMCPPDLVQYLKNTWFICSTHYFIYFKLSDKLLSSPLLLITLAMSMPLFSPPSSLLSTPLSIF